MRVHLPVKKRGGKVINGIAAFTSASLSLSSLSFPEHYVGSLGLSDSQWPEENNELGLARSVGLSVGRHPPSPLLMRTGRENNATQTGEKGGKLVTKHFLSLAQSFFHIILLGLQP